VAGAKLLVVMGHTECGAVKGAVDDVKLGNLTAALAQFVQNVADRNAQDAAGMLTSRSAVIASLVQEQKLKIVAAMHDVGTGVVHWFS
jgi:carbonic anhydrase